MKKLLLFIIAPVFLMSCQTVERTSKSTHNKLYSTLWIQTAAEYEALTRMAYKAAEKQLPRALEDSIWTASLEQGVSYSALPPAIILDIDETVLDNSFYEARSIQDGTSFDPVSWNQWVREMKAAAIPGSLEFIKKADGMGVSIFYITNREAEVEQYTEQNLTDLGYPVSEGSVMSNGGEPNWTSAKTERRKWVAERYRIMMLFGDDLNDFLPARNSSVQERDSLVEEHANKWSEKWFILPNPNYGSWERALLSGSDNEDERLLNSLEGRRN